MLEHRVPEVHVLDRNLACGRAPRHAGALSTAPRVFAWSIIRGYKHRDCGHHPDLVEDALQGAEGQIPDSQSRELLPAPKS